jgi:uncharacterized protein (TIGR02145 family)
MLYIKILILIIFVLSLIYSSCGVYSTSQDDEENLDESKIMDIDGNIYNTIKIGDQLWMLENLRVTRYQNGDTIPNIKEDSLWQNFKTGARCFYDNNYWQTDIYGILYNWYAVIDTRNLAPEGWHIPTDEDWKELEIFLGMSTLAADSTGFRGIYIGGKLKEEGTGHWRTPNLGATNSSGFTSLPAGIRMPRGDFILRRYITVYWTSTTYEYSDLSAYYRNLDHKESSIGRRAELKEYGFSIRCVKN